jgi:hypothetical protein
MDQDEVIEGLLKIKEQVTQLGFDYIRTKLPIAMEDFSKEAEPFITIERVIQIQIKKLKKKKT